MSQSLDDRIAALATAQHGVVTRAQLLAAGLTPRRVHLRVRSGDLRPLHLGVYILGNLRGALEPERAPVMAAVLACGPGALLGYRHAGWLWKLNESPPPSRLIDVLMPGGRTPTRRPGIRAHRPGPLYPGDATTIDRVPVTSPGRTLCDLATVLSRRDLERAVARAERQELIDAAELRKRVERQRGRAGAPVLRAVLEPASGPAFTRSEAERRFLELVRASGVPEPETNAFAHGYEIDFLWPASGIAVEVDGFAYHSSRRSFASDRRRDADLLDAGIVVIRVTWNQILDEPTRVVATLARALERSRVAGGPATVQPARGLR